MTCFEKQYVPFPNSYYYKHIYTEIKREKDQKKIIPQ